MKSKETWKRCECIDSCSQCRVTWTLLLLLLLWVHHNKAAGMNEDQAAHFFFSGSTEWGLHATVVPPLPSLGFIHPSPSSPGWWRAGTPSAFIWAEAVAPINTGGPAEQRSVESLRSPTTLGCSPPIPLFHKKGKWEGKVTPVVFLQWVRHKAQILPGWHHRGHQPYCSLMTTLSTQGRRQDHPLSLFLEWENVPTAAPLEHSPLWHHKGLRHLSPCRTPSQY